MSALLDNIKIEGVQLELLPKDLYIPPEALSVLLQSFEGPLDLLLYLIRKQKMDILDIPMAQVTEQYLQYITMMKELKISLASDYLLMAATLTEIKSRLLLPVVEKEVDEDDAIDPRAELVRQLKAYEKTKYAAEKLGKRPQLDQDIFIAFAAVPEAQIEYDTKLDISIEMLEEAYQNALKQKELNQHHQVSLSLLSVSDKILSIEQTLKKKPIIQFQKLICTEEGRLGLVVTFLALLELIKGHKVKIVQSSEYANITIHQSEI